MLLNNVLEEILLEESVSAENITNVLSSHRCVLFNYNSTEGRVEHTGTRFVVPFAYGLTKKGNPVLRGFQPYGDTTTETPRWKYFRLDRIENWTPTGIKFTEKQIKRYEQYGSANYDGDESMSVVYMVTSFDNDNKPTINTTASAKDQVSDRLSGIRQQLQNNPRKIDLDNNTNNDTQKQDKEIPKEVVQNKQPEEPNDDNVIRAKDQVSDRLSGIRNQLNNKPRKIDLDNLNNKKENHSNQSGPLNNDGSSVIPVKDLDNYSKTIKKDDNYIDTKDQVSDRLSGIRQQLQNNPRKIDLSRFNKK